MVVVAAVGVGAAVGVVVSRDDNSPWTALDILTVSRRLMDE